MFEIQRALPRPRHRARLPAPRPLPRVRAAGARRSRRPCAPHPEETVPCNNDLLAENFIDDGERLWLIDYEYSGNNEPSFELGNVWSESDLSLEQLDELVAAYWGEPRRPRRSRAPGSGG